MNDNLSFLCLFVDKNMSDTENTSINKGKIYLKVELK